MIKTIILDLDGPLLEGIDRHYACYRQILNEHGFSPIAKQLYWSQKRSRLDRRALLSQSNAEQLYDEFLARWLEKIEAPEMLALDRLQPEVLQILRQWKRVGMHLILATMRNHRENTTDQLDRLELMPLLDHVFITGSEETGGKAAAVGKHMQQTQDKAINTVWVGDTEVDIEAANQLQLPVYAVTGGLRNKEKLLEHNPDHLVRDLREVRDLIELSPTAKQGVA